MMTNSHTTKPTTVDTIILGSREPGDIPILQLAGTGIAPSTLELVGRRRQISADTITPSGDTWLATIPLLTSRWGGSMLPPPSGAYRVVGTVACDDAKRNAPSETGTLLLTLRTSLDDGTHGRWLLPKLFRLAIDVDAGAIQIVFSAPLDDHEHGAANQARLEKLYGHGRPQPLDAVFFESFFGQNSSCNPRALDRAISSARPDLVRYWGVADASVEVPNGAIAVIEGSEEWWKARTGARLLIVNDWLRNRFHRHRHQKVLQTWHGTMLKRLALSRRRVGVRTALATLRERSRWDILLAQNPYATRIFRRAYAYVGPIWNEGYPRDDILVHGDPTVIRARLGIPPDKRVLLYAPTWRDDRPDSVDHLDVSRFSEQLGPTFVTLIRGHSRTLQPGEDVRAGGVIDVTSYPDVSDLFLVADALITDYSSVMFDFSVTGKPIYFFTPDLDLYREVLRGFYFDLLPVAPGPVVQSADELVRVLLDPESEQAEYAEKYATWRARFNPKDDGHAAERVVARLLREGVL